MTTRVGIVSGYDLGYVWKTQGVKDPAKDAEPGKGGYYIDAAQAGEPPGRWFGKGAEALGFTGGQEVEREPYGQVYRQVDPRDGSYLGRKPPVYKDYLVHLMRLEAAEPHATAERHMEMEREAAQQTRKSAPYSDMTLSVVKSVSIFHTSIRENERQARLAGDMGAAAWWAARETEMQEALQAANRAGLEHLQKYAQTRTGHHGARVDGQEPGRFEHAGIIVTSWLQGTSRDGDPQDHVHNQIARMARTDADGKWRAIDTMTTRAQIDAVRGITSAHLRSELTRRFGVEWVPRKDGDGFEIKGITRAQIEKYSSRSVTVEKETKRLAQEWERAHGRAPNHRQLLYIKDLAANIKPAKESGPVDVDKILEAAEAKWESEDGSRLRDVAGKVSELRGPGGVVRERAEPGPAPSRDAQIRAMQAGLARVQDHKTTWTRAELLREISDSMPLEASRMAPEDSVALVHELTDRALAGEAGQVISLDAPEFPETPAYLRRELDGKSIYTRPGVARYATRVQMAREQELLDTTAMEGAPHLSREESAHLLGAEADELEAAALAKASEATRQLSSGVTLAQGAAIHRSLTSDRVGYATVGPPGTGKTHVAVAEARMWRDAGKGDVVFITPSQAAATVIRNECENEFPVYNFAQFLGHVEGQRGKRGPVEIRPGTLIQVDEASMMSLADLRDIAMYAADNQSVFRPTGDGGQLTAPEGGGGLSLITRSQEHVQLAEPKRFAARWEGAASLRLRAGDKAVLQEYEQQGRIRGGGTLDQVMDEARTRYLAGILQGKDVLLMAKSNDLNRELSQRIRDDLQHLGLVERGAEATLREGAKASVGDIIVTRKNDSRLGISNGNSWRVEHIDGETITMRKLLDADRETGERRFADQTVEYQAASENADLEYAHDPGAGEDDRAEPGRPADLSYSITAHTAQGRTVWQGNALVTGTEDRNWLTVAMTRGREGNFAWAVGQPNAADPTPGTRPAPELDRYDRIERERAGLTAEEPKPTRQEEELRREPIAVLSDVLDRDGTELSATEIRQRNLANADHLAKLHAIWENETRPEIHARYERELREALPDGYRTAELNGTSTWLYRTLRDAEAAGLNSRQVLSRAINSQPLTGARDVGAVVDARIREQVTGVVPRTPAPWPERVPDTDHQERHDYLTRVAAAMEDRTRRLGEFTAEAPPAWAERAFGPAPDDEQKLRGWQDRAAAVASYREMFGYSDPDEPIGPEPVNSPEARQHWHAAFIALGPVDGHDLMDLTDGQLLNRRNTYETETAWAPQWVGDELRQVRAGADDAETKAVVAAAQAEAARKQDELDAAQLHEDLARSHRAMGERYRSFEAQFSQAMEARMEWERATEQQRHLALTANTEYLRRHPGTDLSPLKSAEPPRTTEEERAQLHVPEAEYEPPSWLAGMAERARTAQERREELRSLRIPDEDHEWEDQPAWPEPTALQRDAILQPPRPEIKPAAEVAERAAEIDREAGE